MATSVYVVGGEQPIYERMKRKLDEVGLIPGGHADAPREVDVPDSANAVLILADMANHPATVKAREQAQKLGIPYVMGSFKSWSVTRKRLVEWGVLAVSHLPPEPPPAPVIPLSASLGDRISAELQEKLREQVSAIEVEIPQTPAPTVQPVLETEEMTKKQAAEAASVKLLKESKGNITNKAVIDAVKAQHGVAPNNDVLKRMRRENGLKLAKRGGHHLKKAKKAATPVTKKTTSVRAPNPADEKALLQMVMEYGFKHSLKEIRFTFNQDTQKVDVRIERLKIEVVEDKITLGL